MKKKKPSPGWYKRRSIGIRNFAIGSLSGAGSLLENNIERVNKWLTPSQLQDLLAARDTIRRIYNELKAKYYN